MTAIWRNDGAGWSLLSPAGFPAEADLHELVEHAPHMLPLAGSPQLVVLGREVLLGGNYADLIALEASGRLVVIEIKLASNAEARRAVVAQILTYAAYLRGLEPSQLEQDVLGKHLAERGFDSLAAAASENYQEGPFDTRAFAENLRENLKHGHFRLVLVLDEAPKELVRLVGYLDAVSDKLLIDLITVSAYQVEGSKVVVPQRVDPERTSESVRASSQNSIGTTSGYIRDIGPFVRSIDLVPSELQLQLRKLADWAMDLESRGLAELATYTGKNNAISLLPYLRSEQVGLVTLYDSGHVQFWRSVFERRSPASLALVEERALPTKVGQGTWTKDVTDELLAALTSAYEEAAAGRVQLESSAIT